MKLDTQLALADQGAQPPSTELLAADPAEQSSFFSELHNLLRGRYWLAVLLALAGIGLGALGGWKAAGDPTYVSRGLIQVRPVLPKLMYSTEQNSMMPMFDSFMMSQIGLMQSNRVITMAFESERWNEAGGDLSRAARRVFALGIRVYRDAQLLKVHFIDTEPARAQAGVDAVIDAYLRVTTETDAMSESGRLDILENYRTAKRSELRSLRDRVREIADVYGADTLEKRYQFKLDELQKIEVEIRRHQLYLAQFGDARERRGDAEPAVAVEWTPERIAAAGDQPMAGLLNQRFQINAELRRVEGRFGENHPMVVRLKEEAVIVEDLIAERRELAARQMQQGSDDGGGTDVLTGTIDDVQSRLKRYREMYETARAEVEDLGRKRSTIQGLQNEMAIVEQQLKDTRDRIESLKVEMQSGIGGRIKVLSKGDDAVMNEDRRVQMAGLGGVTGAAMGFGVVLLIGFFDQRLRVPQDARSGAKKMTLLGVLPDLPGDLSRPEQGRTAAFAVHHIRAMLQIDIDRNQRRVVCITSPSPGDGKTSLVLSLGYSFAASGARTLLIDCDLVAGDLSSAAGKMARRRIGQILLQRGVISRGQLDEAVEIATKSRRRLGEVLLEMGSVDYSDLEEGLKSQQESEVGLIDALAGEPVERCVTDVGEENLWILPSGEGRAEHCDRLSPERIRALFESAKQSFDVVLADCGPVLGSLEASLAVAAADSSVLVVSRGLHRTLVERAMSQIRAVKGRLAGVVFNRAQQRDFDMYRSYSVSGSLRSRRSVPAEGEAPVGRERSRFGPIVGAVTVGAEAGNGQETPDQNDDR